MANCVKKTSYLGIGLEQGKVVVDGQVVLFEHVLLVSVIQSSELLSEGGVVLARNQVAVSLQ